MPKPQVTSSNVTMKSTLARQFTRILLGIALVCFETSAQDGSFTITGRVVNENNQPLPGAYVNLNGKLNGQSNQAFDDLILGSPTDHNGVFRIVTDEPGPDHLEFLYVMAPEFKNAKVDLTPPFSGLGSRYFFPSATPWPVFLRRGIEVNVGDINVQTWYGTVTIFVLDRNNQPLLRTADDWGQAWLRYRDDKGRIVYESGFSTSELERSVNPELSSVTLALPDGVWTVEIQPSIHGRWSAKTGKLKIDHARDGLRVIVRPARLAHIPRTRGI